MDGFDRYIETLEHTAKVIENLTSLGSVSCSDYCNLIEALNTDVLLLNSASTKFQLNKSMSLLDSATIQTCLDSLMWEDFGVLTKSNIRRLFPAVQKRMDKYTELGQMTDKRKACILLLDVATKFKETEKEESGVAAWGDIPRAICYLAEKAQDHGYSFHEGTFFQTLIDGYINGYKDNSIICRSDEILKSLLSCLDDDKWYSTENEIKPFVSDKTKKGQGNKVDSLIGVFKDAKKFDEVIDVAKSKKDTSELVGYLDELICKGVLRDFPSANALREHGINVICRRYTNATYYRRSKRNKSL